MVAVLVGLGLRLTGASVLATFAIGKLAALPHSADAMWRPTAVSRPRWRLLVAAAGAMELAGAVVTIIGGVTVVAVVLTILLALLTAYGIRGLRVSGNCGCSGLGGQRPITAPMLLARNAAVLISGTVGALVLPSVGLGELSRAVPFLAFVPLTFAVTLAVVGVTRIGVIERGRTASSLATHL